MGTLTLLHSLRSYTSPTFLLLKHIIVVKPHCCHCDCVLADYVEPATTAPFHIENDDLKMIDNDERVAVS